jgi:hypothetical protein
MKEYISCPTIESSTKSKKGKGNGFFQFGNFAFNNPHMRNLPFKKVQ